MKLSHKKIFVVLEKIKQSHKKLYVVLEIIKMGNNQIKYSGNIKISIITYRMQALCILRCIVEEEVLLFSFCSNLLRFPVIIQSICICIFSHILRMDDLLGKCTNENCPTRCVRFAKQKKDASRSLTLDDDDKCRNCQCPDFMHELLAVYDDSCKKYHFLHSSSSLDESKTSQDQKGSKSTSAELDFSESNALKAAFNSRGGQQSSFSSSSSSSSSSMGANNKLTPLKTTNSNKEPPQRARGGGGIRFNPASQSNSSKKQKLVDEFKKLAIYFLESGTTAIPICEAFKDQLSPHGQFFADFNYKGKSGHGITQIEFEEFIFKTKIWEMYLNNADRICRYQFYQQKGLKKPMKLDYSDRFFPDRLKLWMGFAIDSNGKTESSSHSLICCPADDEDDEEVEEDPRPARGHHQNVVAAAEDIEDVERYIETTEEDGRKTRIHIEEDHNPYVCTFGDGVASTTGSTMSITTVPVSTSSNSNSSTTASTTTSNPPTIDLTASTGTRTTISPTSFLDTVQVTDYPLSMSRNVICTVCQAPLEFEDSIYVLPCIHKTHVGCLRKWFKSHATCPECKWSPLLL